MEALTKTVATNAFCGLKHTPKSTFANIFAPDSSVRALVVERASWPITKNIIPPQSSGLQPLSHTVSTPANC